MPAVSHALHSLVLALWLFADVATAQDLPKETPALPSRVMAVLSKAGCNAGACHGNQSGKGGFKLSLRGENAAGDYAAVVQQAFGRRIDLFDAEQSLLLRKATTKVAHEGGLRFKSDADEYRVLRDWIANGAQPEPADAPQLAELLIAPFPAVLLEPTRMHQLQVKAQFHSDAKAGGKPIREDVTKAAVYEVVGAAKVSPDGRIEFTEPGEAVILVRYLNQQVPVRIASVSTAPKFAWSAPSPVNYVDQHVFAKLRSLRINPSATCTDGEFVRRAFLDVCGLLPTAEESQAFVRDTARNKRAILIDRLLARPEFAEHWAQKWSDLLRNEEKVLDTTGVRAFHDWIKAGLAEGKPLNEFAKEILNARGSTYKNGAANYWRAHREPFVRAESAAQVFLGLRLQCAKCHNHPFDRWTQDDYYNWAACFARIDYKIVENKRKDNNDSHEFDGEQIVTVAAKGEVTNARTGGNAAPRVLGQARQEPPSQADDRLTVVADWVTAPDNPYFAKVQANRIWFHLLGRGIVDPIDDFRPTNPATNPPLLDALARDFVEHGYDLRHLIRTIMLSRTYQTSVAPTESNRGDEINFSRVIPRRLPAEQLLDAVNQVLGTSSEFNGYPAGTTARQLAGVDAMRRRDKSASDRFLTSFGKPPRLLPSECERSNAATLGQAFQLLSGPFLQTQLTKENRLTGWLRENKPVEEVLVVVYWSALSREPSPMELAKLSEYIAQAADKRAAWEDVAWGVLTSGEFLLRH